MPNGRIWIYVLLFFLSTINYVDRVVLSVAIVPLSDEFHIDTVQKGYLFSAFLYSYLICLIPMGVIVDRFGTRAVNAAGMALWSAATILTGGAWSYATLFAMRLAMGVGESTTYPAGGRVIREWVPRSERGFATAVFNSGAYFGPAFGSLVAGWLISVAGWRSTFFVAGAAGFVWLAAWLIWYRRPEDARFLGAEERARIIAERDAGSVALNQSGGASGVLALLRQRSMWGLALTQGCAVYTQYLFLTWLPSYLQTSKDLSILKTGFYSAMPYLISVVLGILLGRVSDRILGGSGVQSGQRRRMVVAMMLSSAVILLAPFVDNIWAILLLIAVSLTGISTAVSLNMALTNDLLRSAQDAGKAMGILIAGGNIFGILAPIVTGYVIAGTGSFNAAFVVAGLLLLTGATVSLTMTGNPIDTDPRTE